MALYYDRDIETTFAGDLLVDARGDLKMAESAESHLSALKVMMSCDRGELAGHPAFGSNLGSLVGMTDVAEVLRRVPILVREAIAEQGVIAPTDVLVKAFQVDVDKVVVYLLVNGRFLQADGTFRTVTNLSMKWIFPFVKERLTELP